MKKNRIAHAFKWMISAPQKRFHVLALSFVWAAWWGPSNVHAAINVYFSSSAPTSLTDQFLADVTTQYQAVVFPNKFFPGSYNVTVFSKNPPPVCGGNVYLPCDLDADLQLLVKQSTWNYATGYGAGETDERARNLNTLGAYISQCSTSTFFGASTTTWRMGFNCGAPATTGQVICSSWTFTNGWSPGTCGTSLMVPMNDIFTQSYSTPTVIPGF